MCNANTLATIPFTPTPEMISAAECLLLAIAYERTIRPIVEGYEQKILAERKWEVKSEMQKEPGVMEYITGSNLTWLMSGEDFESFRKRCNEERVAANLVSAVDDSLPQDDYCPLLVAVDITRKMKIALCEVMASVAKISSDDMMMLSTEETEKLVEMSLNFLVGFVANPLAKGGRFKPTT